MNNVAALGRLAAVAALCLGMSGTYAQTARLLGGAAAANLLGQAATPSEADRVPIEQLARDLAARHNSDPSRLRDGVVASTAHARGRYVFIEVVLRLKAGLSEQERREFAKALRAELPQQFCGPGAPALKAGIVYIASYKSTHGQDAAAVRIGQEECP